MLFGGAYILSREPLILGCMGVPEVEAAIDRSEARCVLYWPAWNWTLRSVPALVALSRRARARGKQLLFMANSSKQDRMLRRLYLPGRLASLNCFIDEKAFSPIRGPKKYSAIYIAQMHPLKRLWLASDIRSLYVVTYGDLKDKDGNYDLPRYEPRVAHADFNRSWMSHEDVAAKIALSSCGLALSPHEGAMLASVEYLLCGIPLVSTPCQGGREEFFDPRFTIVAQPSPAAIASAVEAFVASPPSPDLVRAATIERLIEHRRNLCEQTVDCIRRLGGGPRDVADLVANLFCGPGGSSQHYVPLEEL